MTPQEYLMQIFHLDKKIDSKLSERDAIMSTLLRATDTSKEYVRTSNISSPTENVVMRLMQYGDEVDNYVDELVALKVQVAEEIMQLENSSYQMILRERYIHCKKFEQIAVDMNYDYSWVIKLHRRALRKFGEVFPEKFR